MQYQIPLETFLADFMPFYTPWKHQESSGVQGV